MFILVVKVRFCDFGGPSPPQSKIILNTQTAKLVTCVLCFGFSGFDSVGPNQSSVVRWGASSCPPGRTTALHLRSHICSTVQFVRAAIK